MSGIGVSYKEPASPDDVINNKTWLLLCQNHISDNEII